MGSYDPCSSRLVPDIVPKMRIFGEVFANARARKRSDESLHSALTEVKRLKDQLEADYAYLKEEMDFDHDFGEIAGASNALKKFFTE